VRVDAAGALVAVTDQERPGGSSAEARRERLVDLYRELRDCRKCALAEGRTTVVFGTGNADADLMFVGEAPGFHEDQQGKPFVGRAGKLLDQLLEEIGLTRGDCFIANTLKCRPPDNRDPLPDEIEACKPHLMRQIELIEPRVICTLGNFATKLLSGSPQGITRVRGVPQAHELAGRPVFLYPIFHPAAALRTTAMLEQLRADFQALPRLLAEALPSFGGEPEAEPGPELVGAAAADQLDLF
jgi:uracil-DNA glycosylase family 4